MLKTTQSNSFIRLYCNKRLMLFLSVALAIALLTGCGDGKRYRYQDSSTTLEFPEKVSLGKLWMIEDPNCFTCGSGEEFLGEARGKRKIGLTSGWFIRLIMPHEASELMPYLKHPSLTAIGDINLEESNIKDDDLKYLAKINLRSLKLNRTGITGSGLKYLQKPAKTWFSLDLQDCKALNLKYLVHFKGWERTTITLWSAQFDSRPDEARKIICDGNSDRVCVTQIR